MKIVTFKVRKSVTIRNLKALIHRKKGNSRNSQESHLASDDGVENGRTIVDQNQEKDQSQIRILNLQNPTGLKIYVKIASSKKTVVAEANGYHIVHDIKSKIHAVEGANPDQYALFHDGKRLEDYRTLVSLGIKTESTLHLIFHPKTFLPISVTTPSGKILKFDVNLLYTVRDVKTIVESIIWCPVSDCKMIYAGNELEDSKSLAFYGVEESSSLELQASWIQIFVKTWSGKTITLYVTLSNTVNEVKEKLSCKVGVPICWQSIVFSGKRLAEDQNLSSYNIHKHSTLHMVLRYWSVYHCPLRNCKSLVE